MDQVLALRVFVRIAETGGFGKTADLLNVPKATVSKVIQELESHLRVKLFQRSTRKVVVTEEGRIYYHHAVRLLGDLDEMDNGFANSRGKPRGRVRVDIGSSLANLILLPLLPSFRKQYPDIQLDVGVSDRPVNLIGEGVDCVIRGGDLPDTSLIGRRIADLEWGTYAARSYVEARGVPSHPNDLLINHDLVGYFLSSTGRRLDLEFHRGDETILVNLKNAKGVVVNDSMAHLTSLVSGLGVGQTFAVTAASSQKSGDLVEVLTDWKRPIHPIHIVFAEAKYNSARMRAFVDWVVKIFKDYDSSSRATSLLDSCGHNQT